MTLAGLRGGGSARGERKRLQVESFRAIIEAASAAADSATAVDATTAAIDAAADDAAAAAADDAAAADAAFAERQQRPPWTGKKKQTVVDFGCGTGNLILPLAAASPETDFVGLDLNPRSVELLRERASRAGLTNVTAAVGLIEDYDGPCTLALALHVCGGGTDAVLLQAQARGAAFVVAPCCVGKLKDGGMKSVAGLKNALSGVLSEQVEGRSDGVHVEEDDDTLVVRSGDGRAPLRVIHPRSRWMRGRVQRPDYLGLAAAADWSGHQGVSALEAGELGRLPRAAKAAVELDRGAAAQEAGYGVRLMKMLHSGAGLKNDVIVASEVHSLARL